MEGGGNSSNMANFPNLPKSNAPASSTIETNNAPSNSTIITNNTPEVAAQNATQAHRRTNKSGLPPLPPQDGPFRQPDHYLPAANVVRLMRRILPPQAKISDEAKETMQECVSEFISFITEEANDRCRSEQRKTITGEDLIVAMSNLGFDNYVEPISLYLNKYREANNVGEGSRARPRPIPIAAPTMMVRSPMVSPNLAYNPRPRLGFEFNHNLMTVAATPVANSIMVPNMLRVGPSVMGTNPTGHNPNAGLEFGSTQGLMADTATVTAATVVADPNSSSFHEVGSSSSNSNDIFDFDVFDFDDEPEFNGSNDSKEAANEGDVLDSFAKYK